jgi:hypothetical protein
MQAEAITQTPQETPFRPFRLFTSDGRAFDIRHPKMLLVIRHVLFIGLCYPNQPPGPIFEDYASVSLLHITAMEPIIVPTPPLSN